MNECSSVKRIIMSGRTASFREHGDMVRDQTARSSYHDDLHTASSKAWIPTFDEVRFEDLEQEIKSEAHQEGYKLIQQLIVSSKLDGISGPFKVATAESITGGLIFSTLVDIPIGGVHKYGCFSVYDTDAKRIMLGVQEPDVYTNRCASQMAVGVLKNTNASLAIAVSGNAMPEQAVKPDAINPEDEIRRLGEVFISVAGYVRNEQSTSQKLKIAIRTEAFNFTDIVYKGHDMAKIWIQTIIEERRLKEALERGVVAGLTKADFSRISNGFNEYLLTSHIASFIRNQTVKHSYIMLQKFMHDFELIVPAEIDAHLRIDSDPSRISEMVALNGGHSNNIWLHTMNRDRVNPRLLMSSEPDPAELFDRTHVGGTAHYTDDGYRPHTRAIISPFKRSFETISDSEHF